MDTILIGTITDNSPEGLSEFYEVYIVQLNTSTFCFKYTKVVNGISLLKNIFRITVDFRTKGQ